MTGDPGPTTLHSGRRGRAGTQARGGGGGVTGAWRRSAIGGLLALLAAAPTAGAAACSPGPGAGGKTFIVAGTVRLSGRPDVQSGQPCAGTGADADLHSGARVAVYGPDGRTLGVGQLDDGAGTTEPDGTVACVWTFFVPDVSADRDTYLVEVTDRGRHPYDPSTIHGRVDLLLRAR